MRPRPLVMSPSYGAAARAIRELFLLSRKGRDESPEADAVRDASDAIWESLTETERDRLRGLSEDLYSITDSIAPLLDANPQFQRAIKDAFEAQQRGEWDIALKLLRRWRRYIAPDLLSYLRGGIWLRAGDPATAYLFFQHAADLEPTNGTYLAFALDALRIADPGAALVRAEDVLSHAAEAPPAAVVQAAAIRFFHARDAVGTPPTDVARSLIAPIESALRRMNSEAVERAYSSMATTLLGWCLEVLGEASRAADVYTQGLLADPRNEALLVSRGLLLYGLTARAISDLEEVVDQESKIVWPYFALAHFYLQDQRFEDAIRVCERALHRSPQSSTKSELMEWIAISRAMLGFPRESVRASFDAALRIDPQNDRARRNLTAFEGAREAHAEFRWQLRDAPSIRAISLAAGQDAGLLPGLAA